MRCSVPPSPGIASNGEQVNLPYGVDEAVWAPGQPAYSFESFPTVQQFAYLNSGALALTAGQGQIVRQVTYAPMLCRANPEPVTSADCRFFTDPDAAFLRCGCGFSYVNGICVADFDVSKATLATSAVDCLTQTRNMSIILKNAFALRTAQCVDPRLPSQSVDLASPITVIAAAHAIRSIAWIK